MSDEPIPAATLVVVREPAGGTPELLMVERAAGMAFAGGALVFPGGRIDHGDRMLAETIGLVDGAAKIAAIRETIEETAIPVGITPVPAPSAAAALQEALIADRPFPDVLDELGLQLDPAELTPFARWLPNFHVTRRFDTLFFLARAPSGDWEPNVIEGECTGAFWLSAAEALDREQRGDAQLDVPDPAQSRTAGAALELCRNGRATRRATPSNRSHHGSKKRAEKSSSPFPRGWDIRPLERSSTGCGAADRHRVAMLQP